MNQSNNSIDISADILNALLPIIQNPDYSNFPNCFMYPESVIKDAIMFIGINPSSSRDQVPLQGYKLSPKDNHKYFRKFEDISEYCNTPWTHLDLLFFRETDQSRIHDILKSENGVQFIWEQLQISDKIIQDSQPKVIIVNNALARTLLGGDKIGDENLWLDYRIQFDNELGTHVWNSTPIFFTSMLTGQRALDNGSYERLKWHIRQTLIKVTEKELLKLSEDKHKEIKDQFFESASLHRDKENMLLGYAELLKFK